MSLNHGPAGNIEPRQMGDSLPERNGNGYHRPEAAPAARRRPHWWLGLALPLLVGAACGGGANYYCKHSATRWYVSGTTIWFPATGNQGASGIISSLVGGASADPSGSVPVLGGLYASPQFGTGPNTAMTALASGRCQGKVIQRLNLPARWHLPPDKAAERFTKNVAYSVDRNGLLAITAMDTDPALAMKIVNTYVQSMKEVSTELSMAQARAITQAVTQKYQRQKARLLNQEASLVALRRGQVERLPLGATASASYADLVSQRTKTKIDLQQTDAQIRSLQQQARRTYGNGLGLSTSVPFAQETTASLRKAERDFAIVRGTYGPDNPNYQEAELRVQQAQAQLRDEMRRQLSAVQQGITPDLASLLTKQRSTRAQLDGLSQAIVTLKSNVLSLPEAQMREAQITNDVKNQEALVNTLESARLQAELAQQRAVPTFQTVDPAGVPDMPVLPRVTFTTVLAALAGLLLALAAQVAVAVTRRPALAAGLRRWADRYALVDEVGSPVLESGGATRALPRAEAPAALESPAGPAQAPAPPPARGEALPNVPADTDRR